MALNPNHAFEDLGDVKCSIAEKNCTPERAEFLKRILEHNGFTVVVVKSPPPKAAVPKPVAPAAEGAEPTPAPVDNTPPPPDTFTVGVTDLTFSPVNAVFNRELVTFDNKIVTPDWWKQREAEPKADEWYWQKS